LRGRAIWTVLLAAGLGTSAVALAAEIPTPAGFLGYDLGEHFTPHERLTAYFQSVARVSDRVRIRTYGRTVEGRELLLAFVGSKRNVARLDELASGWCALADPERTAEARARDLALELPVLVWLSFNVHGNEPSPSEAAIKLLHWLATAENDTAQWIRENVVVAIDPCLNPDGRERYVEWFRSVVGSHPNPDPNSAEHFEPWPGGRVNHYYFDLNRDWVWQTQPESRQRLSVFLAYHPQVHVDFHEMGYNETYFFFPATKPANVFLPQSTLDWALLFGRGNAAFFDARGWEYYTRENFDLFYPGYGDTYPSLQGAIGMTYEQAGHSRAGLVVRRRDGTLLTLRERIDHHFVAAVATLWTAARQRQKLLLDAYHFWSSALKQSFPASAYVLTPDSEPGRVAQLVDLLLRQGVRVGRATRPFRIREGLDYLGRRVRKRKVPAGAVVVPVHQPEARLVATLMEPEVAMPDTFFYDITAWCLPLAFGVRGIRASKCDGLDLKWLSEPPWPEGEVTAHGQRTFAYLVPWAQDGAPRLLYELLARGARVRVARKPFVNSGVRCDRGTLVVPASQPKSFRSDTSLAELMSAWARRLHLRVHAVPTGLSEKGPDLGSDAMPILRRPKIAVLTGSPASATCYGSIWFLLDREVGIPFTALPADRFRSVDLSRYNVLVFPDDYAGGRRWKARLDSTGLARLRDWIQSGGVFVGIKGGAALATQEVGKLCQAHLFREKKTSKNKKKEQASKEPPKPLLQTVEQREHERRLERVPGSILRALVDTTHVLAFGYGDELMTLKTSGLLFARTSRGDNVVVYPEKARVGGYLSRKALKKTAGTPYLLLERRGRGRVVLFVDDPNFRLFWRGLTRLFLNALFFGQIA